MARIENREFNNAQTGNIEKINGDYFLKILIADGNGDFISAANPFPVVAELEISDIQIGAVELKDATTDTRQKVKSDGIDNAAVVTQNSQPLPTGAATSAKQLSDNHNVTVSNMIPAVDNSLLATSANQTNGTQKSIIVDVGGVPAEMDNATHTLQTIEYEHHEIHGGSHYNYADYSTVLGSGDIIEFVMTTPDTTKWVHLVFSVESSTGANLELFEGATGVTGGTTIIPRNNNRNSTNTSDVTLVKDPTGITTDGTRAAGYLVGANRNSGNTSREREYILKQNTSYLVRITSTASSNYISWDVEWYEHVDKN